MIAGILGLTHNAPDELDDYRGDSYAVEVNHTELLDGETVYHGKAFGQVETQEREILVSEDDDKGVTVAKGDPVKTYEEVYTEYVADLDAEQPFVAVDREDGEFLWDMMGGAERARIDLEAWLEDYGERENPTVWADGWGGDHPDDEEPASVRYHEDARFGDSSATFDDYKLVGFEYSWDGTWLRGLITESGYVTIHNRDHRGLFARWIRDEILDYATTPKQEVFED